jgi:ubiquinone/menaquinone biosynthesis C-methylase UbiE
MHPKLLTFRHKLFRYRQLEQEIARRPGLRRILDIGCGDGENLLRFKAIPAQRVGLEISLSRLRTARRHGLDVLQGSGAALPLPERSFDLVYIAHVLHHIADYQTVLAEIQRVLAAGGTVFVVETVTDHPLLRLARRIRPVWQGDEVEAEWSFADLQRIFPAAGFEIVAQGRYNLIFFLWEMLPLTFWPLELFTPIFVYLDLLLARFFSRYSAHCYFVLRQANSS